MSRVLRWLPILTVVMLLGLASVAMAQAPSPTPFRIIPTGVPIQGSGILVGVRQPITVAAGTETPAVIGVQSQVQIAGHAHVALVIDGSVTLTGADARVDTLVLIRADATLGPGTSVGTIRTLSSTITQDPTATVENGVHDLKDAGLFLFGILGTFLVLMFIGWGVAILVSSVVAASMAATQMRRMARSIANEPLKVLGAGLVGFFVPLIVGAFLFVTIVGIPLAVLLFLLVGLAMFVGYLALGVWLGDLLLRRGHRPTDGKPIGSALLGSALLLIVSLVPLVSLFAGWFALGTATLNGWRSFRARGSGAVPPEVPVGPGTPAWVGAPGTWPTAVEQGTVPGTQTGWTPAPMPPQSGPPAGWGQPPVPPPAGPQSGPPAGWGQPPVPPPASGPPPGWGQPPQR